MATARPTLAAAPREVTGKAVKKLRSAGRLPAVVYGHGVDSESVTLDAHEFDLLRRHVGPNALIDLSVDGKKANPVLIQGVQIHPVNRRPLHADLFLSIHHDSVPDNLKERWEHEGKKNYYSDRFSGYAIFVSNDNADRADSLAFGHSLGQ